jgi:hypothetical protein
MYGVYLRVGVRSMGGSHMGKVIFVVTIIFGGIAIPIKTKGPDHILFQLSKYLGSNFSF